MAPRRRLRIDAASPRRFCIPSISAVSKMAADSSSGESAACCFEWKKHRHDCHAVTLSFTTNQRSLALVFGCEGVQLLAVPNLVAPAECVCVCALLSFHKTDGNRALVSTQPHWALSSCALLSFHKTDGNRALVSTQPRWALSSWKREIQHRLSEAKQQKRCHPDNSKQGGREDTRE